MATIEEIGLLTVKDDSGNQYLLYPVTKTEAVDGLDELLALKVNTTDIVDNLESTSTVLPLSANQGKVLGDMLMPTGGTTDMNIGDMIKAIYNRECVTPMYYLGSASSIDVSSIDGYEAFSSDNFFVIPDSNYTNVSHTTSDSNFLTGVGGTLSISKNYDPTRGLFTCSCSEKFSVSAYGSGSWWGPYTASRTFKVYLYTGIITSIK